MPAVTESTMVDSKGEVVTDFIDSVGTSSVSYTYTNTQTSLYIRNDSDVSITVTVNGSPTTVTRLSDTTITAEFTSFSIVAASDTAAFYARSLRGVPTNTTSTSQLNVISGTAASPSITAIADANTGIFFPASETIAFSTNGSERVRINSDGQLVTTAGSAATPAIAPTGDTNTGIFFPAADTISFGTAGGERIRINSSGNVGVGITDQSYKLDVAAYAATPLRVQRSGEFGEVLKIGRYGVSDGAGIGYPADNVFSIITNANERMRITSSGTVGIGTTSPNTTLQVDDTYGGYRAGIIVKNTADGAAGRGTGIEWHSGTGTTKGEISLTAIDANRDGYDMKFLTTATGGSKTTKMTITGAGNVGIGTTSPSKKFTVYSSNNSYDESIQVVNTGSLGGSAAGIKFYTENSTAALTGFTVGKLPSGDGHICTIWNENNSAIQIGTNNLERMRITSAGYLLIGYTSSNGAYPLQVNGQIFATSSTIATSDGRYKKDVVALDGALDIVKALNPVQFSWKDHPVHKFNTDVPTVGFIAQEVEQALVDKSYLTSIIKKSECTWEEETGDFVDVVNQVEVDGELVDEIVQEPVKITHTEEFLGIAESNLIAILTKAVKELAAEVEALKAQLNGN